jgi:DNA-binding response OmpR family regulator
MLSGEQRILVMIGDAEEAECAAGVLERAGFGVTLARDTAGLLASPDAAPDGGFDLLLTDAAVGSTGGRELARLARRSWPSLRVLYMSENLPSSEIDRRHEEFIRKPFDATELVGCVFEILMRGAGGHPARARVSRALVEAAAAPAGPWCPVRRPSSP